MKPSATKKKIDTAACDKVPVRTGFDRMSFMHSYRERPSDDPCRFDVLTSDRSLHAAAVARGRAKVPAHAESVVTPLRSGGGADDR